MNRAPITPQALAQTTPAAQWATGIAHLLRHEESLSPARFEDFIMILMQARPLPTLWQVERDGLLALLQRLARRGDYPKINATIPLLQREDLGPWHARALIALARGRMDAGAKDDGLYYLNHAEQSISTAMPAARELALLAHKAGDVDRARRLVEKIEAEARAQPHIPTRAIMMQDVAGLYGAMGCAPEGENYYRQTLAHLELIDDAITCMDTVCDMLLALPQQPASVTRQNFAAEIFSLGLSCMMEIHDPLLNVLRLRDMGWSMQALGAAGEWRDLMRAAHAQWRDDHFLTLADYEVMACAGDLETAIAAMESEQPHEGLAESALLILGCLKPDGKMQARLLSLVDRILAETASVVMQSHFLARAGAALAACGDATAAQARFDASLHVLKTVSKPAPLAAQASRNAIEAKHAHQDAMAQAFLQVAEAQMNNEWPTKDLTHALPEFIAACMANKEEGAALAAYGWGAALLAQRGHTPNDDAFSALSGRLV